MSVPGQVFAGEALGVLSRFRVEFYDSLCARADTLFELTDAILCADGPVMILVELSMAAEHRHGQGALYAALDRGWAEPARLPRALTRLPVPRAASGRIVRVVDVSNWLRPDAWPRPTRRTAGRPSPREGRSPVAVGSGAAGGGHGDDRRQHFTVSSPMVPSALRANRCRRHHW